MEESRYIENKYDRLAKFYDLVEIPLERFLYSKWRKKYFSPLDGKILDVGTGTGKNIDYYHPMAEVTAIDISEAMLNFAKKRLAASGREHVRLLKMDVEDLFLESDQFDYCISNTVFCSVNHPVKGLKEVKRVLKPGGKAVMIEHVLSKKRKIAYLQGKANPIARAIIGDNINRDTGANIVEAGLNLTLEKNLAMGDVFRLFEATKQP